MVAATSFGGDAIANRLKLLYADSRCATMADAVWFGDSKDRILGRINVRLQQRQAKDVAIVLDDDDVNPEALNTLLPKSRHGVRVEED